MSQVNLSRFSDGFVLKLEGIHKVVYIDDKDKGEVGNGAYHNNNHLNAEFTLSGEETKEELTDLIVNHLREELYNDEIEASWIMINMHSISLSVSEDDDCEPLTNIDDINKRWEDGLNVYACYYDFKLSINGKRLIEDDLKEFFNFEH